jgi:hypothetical protein
MVELLLGLSTEQREIYHLKEQGYTYERIVSQYKYFDGKVNDYAHLYGNHAVISCLNHTVLGHYWIPGSQGGMMKYLCDTDVGHFLSIIESRCDELNCVQTFEAFNIASKLHKERINSAVELLHSIGCSKLAKNIYEEYYSTLPPKNYLRELCLTIGISLTKPELLEDLRRSHCSKSKIEEFFNKYSTLFQRDPALILNADEKHIKTDKKIKVLSLPRCAPILPSIQKLPHYSAVCTITGNGTAFPLTIILPCLKTLPDELIQFSEIAYFISSDSGRMNRKTFIIWCHFINYQIFKYRENSLAPHLQKERILLILDGHNSRENFHGISLLQSHGIDVLILPPHSTHILQCFDVAIAGSLKSHFHQRLYQFISEKRRDGIQDQSSEQNYSMETWREIIIKAFLVAWEESAISVNILHGFRAAGMIPFDPLIPLNNKYLPKQPLPEGLNRHRENIISGQLISNPDIIEKLYQSSHNLFPFSTERTVHPFKQWKVIITGYFQDAFVLSGPSNFLFWIANYTENPFQNFFSDLSISPRLMFFKVVKRKITELGSLSILLQYFENRNIIFLFNDAKSSEKFHFLLNNQDIQHFYATGHSSHDTRLTAIRNFSETPNSKFVSTVVATKGLFFPIRVVYVYFFLIKKSFEINQRESDTIFLVESQEEISQVKAIFPTVIELPDDGI